MDAHRQRIDNAAEQPRLQKIDAGQSKICQQQQHSQGALRGEQANDALVDKQVGHGTKVPQA